MTLAPTDWGLGTDPANHGNPHQVRPEADLPFEPRLDIPTWSETRFVSAFCPNSGVGIYFHGGRHRRDLTAHWAHIAAFLPDGDLVVDRSTGRIPEPKGMATANFRIRIDEPLQRFSIEFDGAGQRMSTRQLAAGPGGSGANYVPMQWQIEGNAVAPVWDIFALPSVATVPSGTDHTQQVFDVKGRVVVAGETFEVDGVGVNDHSSGPRDLSKYGHHCFVVAVLPGMSIHTSKRWRPDGAVMMHAGSIFTRDGVIDIVDMDMPIFGDLLGSPHTFDLSVTTGSGLIRWFRVDILRTIQVTVTEDNDNINGVDWDGGTDPFVATECLAKFTASDGSVGYGHVERSMKRSRIDRVTLARLSR